MSGQILAKFKVVVLKGVELLLLVCKLKVEALRASGESTHPRLWTELRRGRSSLDSWRLRQPRVNSSCSAVSVAKGKSELAELEAEDLAQAADLSAY